MAGSSSNTSTCSSSSNTSTCCSSTTSSTATFTMPPEGCLPYLDMKDLSRLLLTSHRLCETAIAFIRVLQADVTQSSLHSPLPCLPPSPSLGVAPLPSLPPGFEWIDTVEMPPGKQNRRLLRVKRKREGADEGEKEEEEEEEEEEDGCRCGDRRRDSNDNDSDAVKEGGLAPSCCQDDSCPCFRRAHKLTISSSSSSSKKSSNDTTNPSSTLSSSSSSSSLSSSSASSLAIFEFECSSRCHCSINHCRLRPTQALPPPVLRLRYTSGKGWGVFFSPLPSLPHSLPPHTFVAEYVGELIGTEEARRRLALYDKQSCLPSLPPSLLPPAVTVANGDRGEEEEKGEEQLQQQGQQQHNYLLTLLEEGPSFLLRTSIDATQKGNVSRFFNHSCAPNLSVVCVRDGGVLPRLCLFTSREVKEGEELTFAYGEGGREGGRVCRCGAGECKGFLPFYPGL